MTEEGSSTQINYTNLEATEGKISKEEKERRYKAGLCFYCGKGKHLAKECHKKKNKGKSRFPPHNNQRHDAKARAFMTKIPVTQTKKCPHPMKKTPCPCPASTQPPTLRCYPPGLHSYRLGFLNHPTVALSVKTSILARPSIIVNRYLLDTLDSEPVPSDTIRNKCSPSITLRVTLVRKKSGKEINAHALLDSGAKGIIVDHNFAKRHNLMLRTLIHPIPVQNVDGTPNKQGTVKHTMIQVI